MVRPGRLHQPVSAKTKYTLPWAVSFPSERSWQPNMGMSHMSCGAWFVGCPKDILHREVSTGPQWNSYYINPVPLQRSPTIQNTDGSHVNPWYTLNLALLSIVLFVISSHKHISRQNIQCNSMLLPFPSTIVSTASY